MDKAKQVVYIGVFKGAEFKNGLYFELRPLLHCVLTFFVGGKLNLANIGGLNFPKYTPLTRSLFQQRTTILLPPYRWTTIVHYCTKCCELRLYWMPKFLIY